MKTKMKMEMEMEMKTKMGREGFCMRERRVGMMAVVPGSSGRTGVGMV